jgi:hypothetical protein
LNKASEKIEIGDKPSKEFGVGNIPTNHERIGGNADNGGFSSSFS